MNYSFNKIYILALTLLTMLNIGCVTAPKGVEENTFEIQSLAKTDVDLVTESHQRVVFSSLKQLAVKLYKRNPREWKKEGHQSIEQAVSALSADPFPLVEGKSSIDCIRLAFDESYDGDRVKAYVVGLESMIIEAYGDHRSFYMYQLLDPQKLYDSARNIEVASWMIRTKYKENGELFLLSSADKNQVNLSFERLFGKMINAQDMMAQIVADTTHRQIKNVIQSLARVFIPII